MSKSALLLALALVAGCATKINPAASCSGDGSCPDPAFPFCDVDGAIGGDPGACIAVVCKPAEIGGCSGDSALVCSATRADFELRACPAGCDDTTGCIPVVCTPGALGGCAGDDALVCNATGTDYDMTVCPAGCADATGCIPVVCTPGTTTCLAGTFTTCNAGGSGVDADTCVHGCDDSGCFACTPSTTTCAADTLSTCDAHGEVSATAHCDLGCSTDGTHCNAMVPSNGLQAMLDQDPSPPDVDLENGTLDIDDATFTTNAGVVRGVTMVSVPSPSGGTGLQVLVANHLTLINVTVANGPFATTALAAIAKSDVTVSGTLAVHTSAARPTECIGAGNAAQGIADNHTYTGGGGGGGFATTGGTGGAVTGVAAGGLGGGVSGTATLVPLRGGCGGGLRVGTTSQAKGAGAIQLTSLTRITVAGLVKADAPLAQGVNAGGGAGGAILLEAPVVSMVAGASLLVRGAGGAAADGTTAGIPRDDAVVQLGGVCGAACGGNGGDGASPAAAARAGETFRGTLGVKDDGAGGGGGGLGRIRINTADGTFTPPAQMLISGALTIGTTARK